MSREAAIVLNKQLRTSGGPTVMKLHDMLCTHRQKISVLHEMLHRASELH